MKKIIILLALLLVNISFIYAQQLKPNSIIHARHSTFKTEFTRSGHRMLVENNNNTIKNIKNKNQRFEMTDPRTFNLIAAFKQVFSDERLNELVSEPAISIIYYISPIGKVVEVSFMVKPNTLITADELEQLEAAIKAKVYFKVRWEGGTPATNFSSIGQIVRFDRILNGTQK